MRRAAEVRREYDELWDKVWWNRHKVLAEKLERGEVAHTTPGHREVFEQGEARAREVEAKYGIENLGWDDFDWGLLSGKMAALAWALGSDWEAALDT